MSQREWCKECGKQIFTSQRAASELLNNVNSRRFRGGRSVRTTGSKHTPKSSYECPVGNGFHVTRKSPGNRW